MTVGPVLAADLLPGDIIAMRDWRDLHTTTVEQGAWTDHTGAHFRGDRRDPRTRPALRLTFRVRRDRAGGAMTNCTECGSRPADRDHGIASLDAATFARAWKRAAQWKQHGVGRVGVAEVPMLDVLWSVQCQLEKRGVPIGQVPS